MFHAEQGLREFMDQLSLTALKATQADASFQHPDEACEFDTEKPWSVSEWFNWPYDLFALTSLLLKKTGAYRYSLIEPICKNWKPPRPSKDVNFEKDALAWRGWVFRDNREGEKLPGRLGELMKKLNWLYKQNFPIKLIGNRYDRQEDKLRTVRDCKKKDCACQLWQPILELHYFADQTCAHSGLPKHMMRDETSMLFFANMLLARRGTLSRLPKSIVTVLPKMRTPQVGITYRSLSHHLTVHQTEVDVFWRTIPWINREEYTINSVVVPWPYDIKANAFQWRDHQYKSDLDGSYKYFHYEPPKNLDMDDIIDLIREAEEQAERVHLLIFPEAALTKNELKRLQLALEKTFEVDKIPAIIAGIVEDYTNEDADEEIRLRNMPWNKVYFSVFFAGKWYDHSQSKHHRWKLDPWQIRKYGLAGVLSPNLTWWEGIRVPERRLSFFTTDSWLTLCPLICEDLARLEPVSEIIRGVGPTLLLAILLDGPQSKHRWSGHYATIFADDPGSSVLTVTASGMVERSEDCKTYKQKTVALWKDEVQGWVEIDLEPKAKAVMLTLVAEWGTEYTIDGRNDDENAARFVLRSTNQLFGKPAEKQGNAAVSKGKKAKKRLGKHIPSSKQKKAKEELEKKEIEEAYQHRPDFHMDHDLLELTMVIYTIDRLMEEPYEEWVNKTITDQIINSEQELLNRSQKRSDFKGIFKKLYNNDIRTIYPAGDGEIEARFQFQSSGFVASLKKFLNEEPSTLEQVFAGMRPNPGPHWEAYKNEAAFLKHFRKHHPEKSEETLQAAFEDCCREMVYYYDLLILSEKIEKYFGEILDLPSSEMQRVRASAKTARGNIKTKQGPSSMDSDAFKADEYLRIELLTGYSLIWAIFKRLSAKKRQDGRDETYDIRRLIEHKLEHLRGKHKFDHYFKIFSKLNPEKYPNPQEKPENHKGSN